MACAWSAFLLLPKAPEEEERGEDIALSGPSQPRTYLEALGADFLPLFHPRDAWLGLPCGLAHEGGHPS